MAESPRKRSIESSVVTWRYGDLCVQAVRGIYQNSLPTFAEQYPDKEMEFQPVQQQGNRTFLAGMTFDPPLEFTASLLSDDDTGIVTYGFRPEHSRRHIRYAEETGFRRIPPSTEFIRGIEGSVIIEEVNYQQSRTLTQLLDIDHETAYAIAKYINQLMTYREMSMEAIHQQAFSRFGFPFKG
ncbi:MAG: hypothetical protein KKA90_02325 [Nanoarchaeota archaeon]|nr:hypothetical protein [Nanoarchaeota archaeon]